MLCLIKVSTTCNLISYSQGAGDLVFAFNFHPNSSFADYSIPVGEPGQYSILLNTDRVDMGGTCRTHVITHGLAIHLIEQGHGRIDEETTFFTTPHEMGGRSHTMKVCCNCSDLPYRFSCAGVPPLSRGHSVSAYPRNRITTLQKTSEISMNGAS